MEANESTLHTATGFLYRDACTQTAENNIVSRNSRDRVTQTLSWRRFANKSTSVVRDQKVQTIFFPDLTDKILPPRVAKSQESRNAKTNVELPFRRVFIRARTFGSDTHSTSEDDEDSVDGEPPATYRSDEFLIRNRRAPLTRGDFDLLYNLLDRWRWRVLEAGQVSLAPLKIALANSILSREVRLLRAIDSFKTLVSSKTRQSIHSKFLEELSRPVFWRNSRGERVVVVTERVSRARDSKEIYRLLSRNDLSSDERSNLLGRVKELATAHTCRHSRQLARLLEQELELLAAGFEGDWLNSLRDRTKIAFLQLARDSLRSAATQEEENLESRGRRKSFCGICRRLLPIGNFPETKGTGGGWSCNYCLYSIVRRGSRIVFEPYERLLRQLRRTELGMGCRSKLAFAIGPKLIYHLVNDIWHGSSPISASNNLDGLRLVRLYRDVDWSPWNSLLLTKREAAAHCIVEHLETFYGSALLRKFRTRNLQAKLYFHGIL